MIIKKKGRKSITTPATIDLTPVIDSVFLLLIFFMVTTVFIDVRALLVDLPAPGDNSDDQQKKKDVNVTVSVDGNYTVGWIFRFRGITCRSDQGSHGHK